MVERGVSNSGASSPLEGPVDSFLIRHIRTNPGLGFGAVIQATQLACRVSRAGAARHLSRLVSLGDVTLLPDHTYAATEPTALSGRAVTEIRWSDRVVLIHPDGSARILQQREFRVVSGQIDHFEVDHSRGGSQFIWWFTVAGHVSRVPSSHTPTRVSKHRFELATPLTARKSTWIRVCMSEELPKWYRMEATPNATARAPPVPSSQSCGSDSIGISSQAPRFGNRLTPDAYLRLEVVLPEGYPVKSARCRVHSRTEPDRFDSAEEVRLAKLGEAEWRLDGLQRFGSAFTLSVPQPVLDREYEIEWTLPTTDQRRRWLDAQPRRGAR